MLAKRRMRFRPSVLFLVALLAVACDRKAEPSAAPQASLAKPTPSAAPEPTMTLVPPPKPPSYHDHDMPDGPPPRPPSDNAKQIKAWHILIAYQGASNAPPGVTRSKEEAQALAAHIAVQARAGADFEELVKKYSDDPSAKTNKGYLGVITRDQMPKAFTDVAFGLLKPEVAMEPVETPLGFHIIKRTE